MAEPFGKNFREGVRLILFDPREDRALDQFTLSGMLEYGADGWDLAPKGTEIVSLDATAPTGRLRVLDLATKKVTLVDGQLWRGAQFVSWTADTRGWIVARFLDQGGDVFYVDRDGSSKLLWTSTFQRLTRPTVSPDGRHIAFTSGTMDTSVWMMRGF